MKKHTILNVLDFVSVILLLATIAGGFYYINEFGTTQYEGLGISAPNYYGVATGFLMIISGSTASLFFLSFSYSMKKILNYIDNS